MDRLPASLAIGLWFTGSIWLVAILVFLFDLDPEVIWAAGLAGAVAGVWEWMSREARK